MENIVLRNEIERLLLSTERPGIDNLIMFLRKNDYYKVSCHRHHKFTGGMALHALEVYRILRDNKDCNIPEDSKIIASLLHDLCDIPGFYKIWGHGSRSVILTKFIKGFKLTDLERKLIKWHMYKSEAFKAEDIKEEKEFKKTKEWSAMKSADFKSSLSNPKKMYNIHKKGMFSWF